MLTEFKSTNRETRKHWIIALFVIMTASVFYLSSFAAAEMYRWVDENGDTQISDSPPPTIKSRGGVKVYRSTPQESEDSATESGETEEGKPSSATKKKHNVVLYGTDWCPVCHKARAFFRKRGIAFIDYDVDRDKEAESRFKKLNPQGGVPFVIINGRSFRGFSEAFYEGALQQ